MEERKGNTVLLTVIAIATLLVAVVGATFAYFTATVTGNDAASSIIVKTASLSLTYNDGTEINVTNVEPGWTATKTFSVENTSTVDTSYDVKFIDLTNTVTTGNLVYSVAGAEGCTGCGTVAETAVPTAAGNILTNVAIAQGATHNYTMTVRLKETSSAQNEDQGKAFSAKINITALATSSVVS